MAEVIHMVPISMLGDAQLIAKRAELEQKMKVSLTQMEAVYLEGIVTEMNRRRGIR